MTIQTYLETLNLRYRTGNSREHTYRGDLQTLLMTLLPDILVTNEPAHISCGVPDYLLTRKDIPVGYIEAKDIGVDLNSKTHKEQFERYKAGLNNLIFTDYLKFEFYRDGVFVSSIAVGKLDHGDIIPLPENYNTFESLVKNFALTLTQSIRSPTRLAEMMAGKARLMADVIVKSLDNDDENHSQSGLKKQMLSFKGMLIHDITNQGFADIYAQTIAYGLFAARYHDPTLEDFSRQEAANLIPKSNPFLRKLFQDIAGYDLDSRLLWIVEELITIFLASDVAKIMKNFGRSTKQEDPVVHFYETFLAAYNPKIRKQRGVWYTPQPIVNFIVRAVDDILKDEFNLNQGLADTSKIKIKTKHFTKATTDQRSKLKEVEREQEIHKVQILDPATGTGTFLAEVVRHIYKKFEGQQGIWSKYVNKDLIPRLNGFELLMASYAMAHLKMDMLLTETGYTPTDDQRFRIFLTNSLEEAHPDTGTLFSSWLSDEADQANAVKRDTPVMVIMGNPPYNGESKNQGKWILKLMEDYKREPNSNEKLKEKNSKWINDDYVKFIRFAQYFIEINGEGILAYVNPHGYLDNPTFRGMRWNLLQTYDKIYTLDLHGSTNKQETAPNGDIDKNVFDIKQGVSINFFIKTGKKNSNTRAKLMHYDLYGKRELKYDFLLNNSIGTIEYTELTPKGPNYFFTNKNYDEKELYEQGFSVNKLFRVGSSGVVSKRDKLNIHSTKDGVIQMLDDVLNLEEGECRRKYYIPDDVRDWNFSLARKDIISTMQNPDLIQKINYRPFDSRYFYYTRKSKGVVGWPVPVVSDHLLHKNNIGLMTNKKVEVGEFAHCFVYNGIVESHALSMKEINYVFPLYIYDPNTNQQTTANTNGRTPNLRHEIINQIEKSIGRRFTNESDSSDSTFSPIDVLDYIYAVLHSPLYRGKFNEFLKIDFPRVPYPRDSKSFFSLAKLGKDIRKLHLLESQSVEYNNITYPVDGDHLVVKHQYLGGKIFINELQFFGNASEGAWNFYIGGYQPAQKWLKDRKGKELSYEDVIHYQKIIATLTKTAEIMKDIDRVFVADGYI